MRALALTFACLALSVTLLAQRGADSPEPTPGDLTTMAQAVGQGVTWTVLDPVLIEEGKNRTAVNASKAEAKDFDRVRALDQALEKAREMKRLVLWYAPRITSGSGGRQMYRPAVLDNYAMSVLFSEPECVEILNRSFITARLICDKGVGEKMNITAPELVEPAIFVLTPDGAIAHQVHSLRSFNAQWFQQWLLMLIMKHETEAAPSAATLELLAAKDQPTFDPLSVADAHRRDGNPALAHKALEAAPASTDPKRSRNELLLRAKILRSEGRIAEAQVALDVIQKLALVEAAAPPSGEAPPRRSQLAQRAGDAELNLELGRLALLRGEIKAAMEAFTSVKLSPFRIEAQYRLGVCHFFDRNETFASRRWKEVVALDRASPFALRAAGHLIDGADRTSLGPILHGFEDPFLPQGGTVDITSSALSRSPKEIEDMAKAAVRYLLRLQRENGGWMDSRYAYWPNPELTPNAWVAATAVATASLLEWRDLDPQAIDIAVQKGESYLLDERHMNRGQNEEIYADGYKLLYLAKKFDHARSDGERDQVRSLMNEVVRHLHRTQNAKGFWAHEYPNPFSTGAIINSLALVKERGATVPPKVFEDGASALLSVRNEKGAYAYGAGRAPSMNGDFGLKDSMARSPICEASLIWSNHAEGKPERVTAAMNNFWEYWPRLEKIRRCDFHTDGELAGFFFWHGMFHTTEALKTLPADQQAAHKAKLLEVITRLSELDGSFIDSHEMGKSYGTGMGLLTLKNLITPLKP